MVSRCLELAFIFSGQPFAWRCSVCGRVFVPFGSQSAPDDQWLMEREFRQHLCSPLPNVVTIDEISEQTNRTVPSVPLVKDR